MRILLLGASGQLGTKLAETAISQGYTVFAPSSSELPIEDRTAVFELLGSLRAHLVVNAAAFTNVEEAEGKPEEAFRVNSSGPENLALACSANSIPLIHFSSDYVFDGRFSGAYQETDPPNPINVYGASKLEGEQAIKRVLSQHVILRISWLFSSRGKNFVKTILGLSQQREELRVVNDQIGCPTSVDSVADLCLRIWEGLVRNEFPFGTYHFGGRPETSWYEYAVEILNQAYTMRKKELRCQVLPVSSEEYLTKATRPLNTTISSEKLQAVLRVDLPDWREDLGAVIEELLDSGSS